jgi:hypothetical protein
MFDGAALMAPKPRRKAGRPKLEKAPPRGKFTLPATERWRDWLAAFAHSRGRPSTETIVDALRFLAEHEGFGEPMPPR